MANVKITELTAYTDPVSTDVLPIVDVSSDATKKVSIADLLENAGTGSAAAPSFSFDGDSNTGIYRPGEDQIAISTNGTQRLSINSAGLASFANNVIIEGDLTVNGATTTIDSTTLIVEDKNIEMGSVTTPTDSTADGGGITLKGATDKTINWVDATDAWTLSEHVNIASGKEYRIAGTKVLDATSLGSAVVGSSLTSVGTIGAGVWNGTAIATAYIADSAITSAKIADGAIVNADVNASAAIADTKLGTISTAGKVSNSATTATAVNTASKIVARDGSGNFAAGTITAALTGNASTTTALATARNIGGVAFDGTANINLPGVNAAGNQNTSGNAATSTALSSARNFAVTGDVTGTVSSDLTSGASIATSIAAGVIVNADVNASAAITGSKITTGTTSAVGVLQLTDSTSSTSTTTAATPNSVKTAYDLANAALPKAGGTLTGDLTIPDKIIHSGDTNTFIRFPANDTVSVETAGSERLRIDSSGNVGIGTTSLDGKLNVSGSIYSTADQFGGVNAGIFFSGWNNFGAGVYSRNTGQALVMNAGSSERMRIDANGRVMMGTTSNAGGALTVDSGGSANLVLRDDSIENHKTNSNSSVNINYNGYANGTTQFRDFGIFNGKQGHIATFDGSTSRVGIGTATPATDLHIHDSSGSGSSEILLTNGDTGATATDGLKIALNTGEGGEIWNYENDYIRFGTNNTERLRIDSSGRLLVGTSTARSNFDNTTNAARFQIEGADNTKSTLAIIQDFNANTLGARLILAKNNSTTVGSNVLVDSGDTLGAVSFQGNDGSQFVQAATVSAQVDGTPGANDMPGRLVFSTCADGASSPTERMRINSSGEINCPGVYTDTTALAANVRVGVAGGLQRSTSSIKYKTSVETLENSYADALLSCRPVWYKSKCAGDDPTWGHWGFIAEEVAEIDPRLVHWKTSDVSYDENGSIVETASEPEPEGVQYDRFVPHLLNLIKRQQAAIETLEAKVTALESA